MSGSSAVGVEAEVTAWLEAAAERVIHTACAHVFLGPTQVWKTKRHVDLGYADFSTLERRQWALERELAFNRATAPDIYRAVRRISRGPGGGLVMDGDGEAVEYVLEMQRFDERQVLSAQPQAVDGALAEALGRMIARYHADSPRRPGGGRASIAFTVGSNAALLRDDCEGLDPVRVAALAELTAAEFARQAPRLDARSEDGFARRCHGDLHLGNMLLRNGRPVLFDCIEFNDLLSDIDVQYDLAFLLMDLEFRGRRDAASRVLSAYLDEAARGFPASLWDGLSTLPLMLSVRAAVRAHVSAHSGDVAAARAYVDAAIAHLAPPRPRLVAVGGLSGSGKSSFSRAIAPHVGGSPGAVVLRTDEIRKRQAGAAPTTRLDRGHYGPQRQAQTYDAMLGEARALLRAGRAVVLDATFLDPGLRNRAQALAAELDVPFHSAWLEAPLPVLEARVARRIGDASDATVAVLRAQAARSEAVPATWTRVDASKTGGDGVASWLAACVAEVRPSV